MFNQIRASPPVVGLLVKMSFSSKGEKEWHNVKY